MKRVLAAAAGITLVGVVGIGAASAATGSGPGDGIADALAGLVRAGTITEEQADAVAEALGKQRAEAREERDERRAERQADVDALLRDALGMTREDVRDQLRAGKTLKEVAGDKADELAAAAVALVEKRATEAVAEGRLTQGQADAVVDRAEDRVEAWLTGEDDGPGRGMGLGLLLGGRGMGMGGMRMDPGDVGRGPRGTGMWFDEHETADTSATTAST
jgi:polyhydroxyalkanoate synthesis regulator phasin